MQKLMLAYLQTFPVYQTSWTSKYMYTYLRKHLHIDHEANWNVANYIYLLQRNAYSYGRIRYTGNVHANYDGD